MNWARNLLKHISLSLAISLNTCDDPTIPEKSESESIGREKVSAAYLYIHKKRGSITNQNYATWSPGYVSIWLNTEMQEPTALFFGLQNEDGYYMSSDFSYITFLFDDSRFSHSGWYLLVFDPKKELLGSSYEIRFIQ